MLHQDEGPQAQPPPRQEEQETVGEVVAQDKVGDPGAAKGVLALEGKDRTGGGNLEGTRGSLRTNKTETCRH